MLGFGSVDVQHALVMGGPSAALLALGFAVCLRRYADADHLESDTRRLTGLSIAVTLLAVAGALRDAPAVALVRNLELFAPTAGVLAFAAVTTRKHSLSRRSEALLRVGGTVVVAVISLAAFQTQRTLIVLALAIPASLFTGFYLAGVYTDASTSALGLVVGIVVAAPILFVLPFTPAEAFTRSFLPMFLSVGAVVSMPLCILAYRIGAAHTVTGAEHTANWARSRS